MKTDTKRTKTPRARNMWANYYPENPTRPVLHKFRKDAEHCVAPGAAHAAIPVAVIPLHDSEALVRCAYEASRLPGENGLTQMRAALAAIGVLPKKGRK